VALDFAVTPVTLPHYLSSTVEHLDAISARDEALAVRKASRGFAVIRTPESMTPVGRAWRLGVLLLARDGSVGAAGKITRAVKPGWAQNLSASVEERRSDRMAASRGKFAEGEVVNYDFTPLALDAASLERGSGPLLFRDGVMLVRWSPTGYRPLEPYVTDRIEMLLAD
jgi:hypothetical protein